jgi:hypothetical protein
MHPRFLLVLLAFAVLGPPTEARASEADVYAGTWTFDESSGDRALAETAVVDLAKEHNFFIRGIVKTRLLKSIKISSRLVMEPGDDTMTITSDFSKWTSDLSATVVSVLNDEGDPITLKRWLEQGTLHAVGAKGASSKDFVFRIEDAGETLILEITTSSPRLKRPLAYSLTYRKPE